MSTEISKRKEKENHRQFQLQHPVRSQKAKHRYKHVMERLWMITFKVKDVKDDNDCGWSLKRPPGRNICLSNFLG